MRFSIGDTPFLNFEPRGPVGHSRIRNVIALPVRLGNSLLRRYRFLSAPPLDTPFLPRRVDQLMLRVCGHTSYGSAGWRAAAMARPRPRPSIVVGATRVGARPAPPRGSRDTETRTRLAHPRQLSHLTNRFPTPVNLCLVAVFPSSTRQPISAPRCNKGVSQSDPRKKSYLLSFAIADTRLAWRVECRYEPVARTRRRG